MFGIGYQRLVDGWKSLVKAVTTKRLSRKPKPVSSYGRWSLTHWTKGGLVTDADIREALGEESAQEVQAYINRCRKER